MEKEEQGSVESQAGSPVVDEAILEAPEASLTDDEFGPLLDLHDEIAEPLPEPKASGPEVQVRLARSILLFGVVVTALLVVQTWTLLQGRSPDQNNVQPVRSTQADGTERLLRRALVEVDQGFYQDVIEQLAPLETRAAELSPEQRFRLFSTLSLAHRRMHRLDRAALYTARATGQFLEQTSLSGLLKEAQGQLAQGQLAEARVGFARVLVQGDDTSDDGERHGTAARVGLADCYVAMAVAHPDTLSLPGYPDDISFQNPEQEP